MSLTTNDWEPNEDGQFFFWLGNAEPVVPAMTENEEADDTDR